MKSIVLSVVVVSALVVAGIGGTLADFSDIEVAQDNYFSTGYMDLIVSDDAGYTYNGAIVPALWEIASAWPCCSKDVRFDLHMNSAGTQDDAAVYLHFKNIVCHGELQIEPEEAAEYGTYPIGELADGTLVYATEDGVSPASVDNPAVLGTFGETCDLKNYVDINISWGTNNINGPWPNVVDMSTYDLNGDKVITLNEIECQQILLTTFGETSGIYTIYVNASLHFSDLDEDDLYAQGIISRTFFDDSIPAEAKWDHWPTNALMDEKVTFDLAFELLQD